MLKNSCFMENMKKNSHSPTLAPDENQSVDDICEEKNDKQKMPSSYKSFIIMKMFKH